MDKDERIKVRNKERLEDDDMMLYALFLAAAMAGGEKDANRAGKSAQQAIDHLRAKFT